MKTFIIRSASDQDETIWIVNAINKKSALEYVYTNEEFYDDENILSCVEFNTHQAGVVFLEARETL